MKICTPSAHSLSNIPNEAEFSPKESTIQAILDFAAECNQTDTIPSNLVLN